MSLNPLSKSDFCSNSLVGIVASTGSPKFLQGVPRGPSRRETATDGVDVDPDYCSVIFVFDCFWRT